jgi:hypothetical protein
MVWGQLGSSKLKIPCPLAVHMYNDEMQGVDHHYQLRSKFDVASCRGFKKYYIMHHLAQRDIGMTNTGIYFFLANPNLNNKKGQRRKFNEDIILHSIMVKPFNWEVLYGNSVLDINSGTICTPGGVDSEDDNLLEQLRVPN